MEEENKYATQKRKELDELTISLLDIDAQLQKLEDQIKRDRSTKTVASEAS